MMLCHISAYSGTSKILFSYKNAAINGEGDKESINGVCMGESFQG